MQHFTWQMLYPLLLNGVFCLFFAFSIKNMRLFKKSISKKKSYLLWFSIIFLVLNKFLTITTCVTLSWNHEGIKCSVKLVKALILMDHVNVWKSKLLLLQRPTKIMFCNFTNKTNSFSDKQLYTSIIQN